MFSKSNTATPSDRAASAIDSTTPTPAPQPGYYTKLSQVGEGTYGKVYKASSHGQEGFVALKRIKLEKEKSGFPVTAMREMKLLQGLRHGNVISLLEIMVHHGTYLFVSMTIKLTS